jgi:hypothetical protein
MWRMDMCFFFFACCGGAAVTKEVQAAIFISGSSMLKSSPKACTKYNEQSLRLGKKHQWELAEQSSSGPECT